MATADPELDLLMVHADDHAPVLAEGLASHAARGQRPDARPTTASDFWEEGGDPNDLPAQRWGILAPRGPEGDRLLALAAPLIQRRQDQQGDKIKVFRVPPQMTQDEAMRWKKREFDAGADLNIESPRYQLILGDLDQVPLAVQQVQQTDGYVGRLAFTREDDYAAYVDKVVRWEKLSQGTGHPDALFYTVHDGTAATASGHAALIAPGVEVVRRRQAAGQYPARDIVQFGDHDAPSPDELLRRAASPEPGVLFTLSHGEGAPRGGWHTPEEQRRRQGAMSFGRGVHLTGDDLRGKAFMPGGVWFMLACYGAGTPSASAYRHWLTALAAAGQFRGKPEAVLAGLPGARDRPFIAALPQAALASADGPLAFMGHIDLAWTYSFQQLDEGAATNRPARYMGITRALLKRDRAGVALRELTRFFDQTNVELTGILDREAEARAAGRPVQPDAARQGHLWMLRQDLAAYVLLGDPAVRLPLAQGPAIAAPPPPQRPLELASEPARAAADPRTDEPAAPTSAPAEPPPRRADEPEPRLMMLEKAVMQCILADLTVETAAARVGLPRPELERLVARYREFGRRVLVGHDRDRK